MDALMMIMSNGQLSQKSRYLKEKSRENFILDKLSKKNKKYDVITRIEVPLKDIHKIDQFGYKQSRTSKYQICSCHW